jgi:hypothetical protein
VHVVPPRVVGASGASAAAGQRATCRPSARSLPVRALPGTATAASCAVYTPFSAESAARYAVLARRIAPRSGGEGCAPAPGPRRAPQADRERHDLNGQPPEVIVVGQLDVPATRFERSLSWPIETTVLRVQRLAGMSAMNKD